MTKLADLSIETLQEVYAVNFFKVYSKLPTAKHLETNKRYLIAKIDYLRKQRKSIL